MHLFEFVDFLSYYNNEINIILIINIRKMEKVYVCIIINNVYV